MDLCRTSGKRSGLLPVRFGQRAHAPAFGRSVSSCGSKGAFVRSRWISRSIHARSSRTVVASAFLSFRMVAAFRYCGKHSCRARRWSFAHSRRDGFAFCEFGGTVAACSGDKLIRARSPIGKRAQENRLEYTVLFDVVREFGQLRFIEKASRVGFGFADFRQRNVLNG